MNATLLALCALFCALSLGFGQPKEPTLDPRVARELFDGQSLQGFVQKGGRYDGTARWTVEDGLLVGRQGPGKSGGLLYTELPYRDLLVQAEIRIDWPFDSGLFFRMQPPGAPRGVQVTLDARESGQIGALYADGWLKQYEAGVNHWKRDDWNRVTVRCQGARPKISVWVNGVFFYEHALGEQDGEFSPEGLLGLQVHGGESVPDETAVRLRSLKIVELPDAEGESLTADDRGRLSATAANSEWIDLLQAAPDERLALRPKLRGLAAADAFDPETGVLSLAPRGAGELSTDEFEHFELRLDFRIEPMANSGLFLRQTGEFPGQELQILDDHRWEQVTGTKLKPYQFTGGLYYFAGPETSGALRPAPAWNTYRVRLDREKFVASLNGKPLHNRNDLSELWLTRKIQWPERGRIALQRHAPKEAGAGLFIHFRNFWLRPLP